MQDGAYLYIVRCADGSFYTGTTRATDVVEVRARRRGARTAFGASTPAAAASSKSRCAATRLTRRGGRGLSG